jgi:rare lipoprotein A
MIARFKTVLKLVVNVLAFVVEGATPAKSADAMQLTASYYGHGERLSRHTANGEAFNPEGLTCAHRTLPFGTKLKVALGGRSIIVRVTDRGPAASTGRALDLSYGAARAIGLLPRGTARVEVVILN